jgi:uncharacterized protein DUF4190
MNDDTTPAADDHSAPASPPVPNTPASSPRTNVLAVISLIVGFFVPLAAFICGGIALSQIKRTGDRGRGLAWSGIIVGALVTVATIVVSIGIAVGTAAALTAASDAMSESRSLSDFGAPGCEELGAMVLDAQQDLSEVARAKGAERTDALAELQELAAEAHSLASTITDSKVADAAETAATALDEVVTAMNAVPTGAAAADAGSTYEALVTLKATVTTLSGALTELETVCR